MCEWSNVRVRPHVEPLLLNSCTLLGICHDRGSGLMCYHHRTHGDCVSVAIECVTMVGQLNGRHCRVNIAAPMGAIWFEVGRDGIDRSVHDSVWCRAWLQTLRPQLPPVQYYPMRVATGGQNVRAHLHVHITRQTVVQPLSPMRLRRAAYVCPQLLVHPMRVQT